MSTLSEDRGSTMERSTIAARHGVRLEPATERQFVLDQRIRYSYSAPIVELHQQLRVIPPLAHGGQRRRRWSLSVSGVSVWTTRESLDAFGNLLVTVNVPRVEQAVEIGVHVEAAHTGHPAVHSISATPHLARPKPPTYTRAATLSYTEATALTAANDDITDLALAGTRAGSDATRVGGLDIEALCERVHRSIAYHWGVTSVDTTASEALGGGLGVCQDYAHIMLAACRRAGQPARYVSGHLVGEGGSHAWVEILRPDESRHGNWLVEGWDPTHNRRTDHSYLVVAVGRDYRDAAPLSGTFVGDGITSSLDVSKRLSA